jgi:uncharacterized protein (DUF1778 family)
MRDTSPASKDDEREETGAVLVLTKRESLAFAEAILNPPEPRPALREAARRYRQLIDR